MNETKPKSYAWHHEGDSDTRRIPEATTEGFAHLHRLIEVDSRSRWPRMARRVALAVLAIYIIAALIITAAQRRMIYFPTRLQAAPAERWAAEVQLRPWTNATGQVIGWQRLISNSVGRVLVFHGNAGCAIDRDFYANRLQAAEPLDVYLVEYPGYGSRDGEPTQESILNAAREALALLKSKGPLFVLAESLGTGAASYLAGSSPQDLAGLILIAPYNNFTAAAQAHMPIFPVRWMLKDKFPSDAYLESYRGPVAVLLAGRDEVIPSRLGRKLYEGYIGPKKLWEYPRATHNSVALADANIWREILAFLHQPNPVARPPSKVPK